MSLTGPCASLTNSTVVTINELTTVASEWALAQFSDATGQVFGSGSITAGLVSAVDLASRSLVNYLNMGGVISDTGVPAPFLSTIASTCSGGTPHPNCDALERLDSLANDLAACIQSAGPDSALPVCGATTVPCDTLLACTGTPATSNTLQAIHSAVTHPQTNVNFIFNAKFQLSTPVFQPDLAIRPDGFELAIVFMDSSVAALSGAVVDALNNVWWGGQSTINGSIGDQSSSNFVFELSPSLSLLGVFNPSGANFSQPGALAIDSSGNVWVPNIGNASVTELNSSGGLVANFSPPGGALSEPVALAIDPSGNAWVVNQANNSVTELNSSGGLVGNFSPSGANFSTPNAIAIDASGKVWVPNSLGNSVTALNSSGGLVGNFSPSGANFSGPNAIAIDASGNVWVSNLLGNSVTVLNSSGGLVGNFDPGSDLVEPQGIAIDSAGHAWVVSTGIQALIEMDVQGQLFVKISVLPDKVLRWIGGDGIDEGGNIWLLGQDGSVTELVGLAAPVRTPLVACLKQTPPEAVCLP